MTSKEIEAQAGRARWLAVAYASDIFKIPEDCNTRSLELMIDEIINCAVLTVTAAHKKALEESTAALTTEPSSIRLL